MKKKQRLYFILFILASLFAAAGLALYALQDNIAFFYSPVEVVKLQAEGSPRVAAGHVFRLGGLVKNGTLKKSKTTTDISFIVTDEVKELPVTYRGILPDLFREGQGVVATGSLKDAKTFIATEILAKHDEKYMPPEAAKALERAAKERLSKP